MFSIYSYIYYVLFKILPSSIYNLVFGNYIYYLLFYVDLLLFII